MKPFRPASELSAIPAEAVPPVTGSPGTEVRIQCTSEILDEAILASVSSVRDSLPEQHRAHFETLRQEIIDFAQAHGIPREALSKSDALREAAEKLSAPNLERLALLLERFSYLLVHHEFMKEDCTEVLEYGEEYYHLKEQYDSQVEFLKQVGILHSKKESEKTQNLSSFFRSLLPFGKKKRPEVSLPPETSKIFYITGIDGNEYPIPTLEQIAARLFERRKELETKHDQGFTKLLLVPFGMSLDALLETLKRFLFDYKQRNLDFDLDTDNPLWTWKEYQGADIGDSPDLVYYPRFFDSENHQGKTKMEILKEQAEGPWIPASAGMAGVRGGGTVMSEGGVETPGWIIHLLQPSNMEDKDTEIPKGFAPIPREGQGIPQGDENPRLPLEACKTPNEYLSILKKAKDDPNSPYFQESGMTLEDWIMAFMIHLSETGKPLDNERNPINIENISYLTGTFSPSSLCVPRVHWSYSHWRVVLAWHGSRTRHERMGARSSVIV